MKIVRDAVHKAVEDPDFKSTMAKINSPIQYMDAPEFANTGRPTPKRLGEAVKAIGRVDENK